MTPPASRKGPRVPKGYRIVTRGRKRIGDRVWIAARIRNAKRGIWSSPIECQDYFFRHGDPVMGDIVARPRPKPRRRKS